MLKRNDACSALEQISIVKQFLTYYSESAYIFCVSPEYVYAVQTEDLIDLRNSIIKLLEENNGKEKTY